MTASPAASIDLFLALDPLAPGEDRAAFEALRQSMHQALAPADAVERIWAQEAATLTWEIARLERLRTETLTQARLHVLQRILCGHLTHGAQAYRQMNALIKRYQERDPDAATHIERLLHERGLDTTLLITHAYGESLPRLEILDKMASRTEHRRARLLREIGRRKDFARRVQAATRLGDLVRDTAPPRAQPPGTPAPGDVRDAVPRPSAGIDQPPPPRPPVLPAEDDRLGHRPPPDASDDRLGRRPSPDLVDDRLGRRPSPDPDADRLGRRPAPAERDADRLGHRPPADPADDRLGRRPPPDRPTASPAPKGGRRASAVSPVPPVREVV